MAIGAQLRAAWVDTLAQLRTAFVDVGGPPSAPATITGTAGGNSAIITWSASAGASTYNIYWSLSSPVSKSDTKITNVTSPYAHTGLTEDIPVYYVVTAENPQGESDISTEVTVTPFLATVTNVVNIFRSPLFSDFIFKTFIRSCANA